MILLGGRGRRRLQRLPPFSQSACEPFFTRPSVRPSVRRTLIGRGGARSAWRRQRGFAARSAVRDKNVGKCDRRRLRGSFLASSSSFLDRWAAKKGPGRSVAPKTESGFARCSVKPNTFATRAFALGSWCKTGQMACPSNGVDTILGMWHGND